METKYHGNPDPDELLAAIRKDEAKASRGRLKIFLGMCAGVGKTYSMLKAAHEKKHEADLVVGYVETHNRKETEELTSGLEIIPRKKILYKEIYLEEMDLDAIIGRKPAIVLIDELAHTNVPGSRHTKRYQDILEILDNGIDVVTTLNVQHIESRNDTVSEITGIIIRETVPDSIIDIADDIELVDLSPEDLLKRLAEGKVYISDKANAAAVNFFRTGNLTALREMSLRLTADRVDKQLQDYMLKKNIIGPWKTGERLMVAIGPSPYSSSLIRWTRRLSTTMNASWIAVYVDTFTHLPDAAREQLVKNINLAEELGAEIIKTTDEDIVAGLLRIARQKNISQIVIGKSLGRNHFFRKKERELVNRLLYESGDIDIYVVRSEKDNKKHDFKKYIPQIKSGIWQYITACFAIAAVGGISFPLREIIGYQTVGLLFLLAITLLPLIVGRGPILTAALFSAVVWNYFFIPPIFTFHIESLQDIITLLVNLSVAIVMGILTTKIRLQQKSVKQREETAVALYNLTELLSKSRTKIEVINNSVNYLSDYFSAMVSILLRDEDGALCLIRNSDDFQVLSAKEMNVAEWAFKNGKKAGKLTENIPSAEGVYFPLKSSGLILGVIGFRFRNKIGANMDNEVLLNNFIQQISSAIDRAVSEEKANKIKIFSESEKLYHTLLDSISHEFRTPIAVISGAASSLQDENIINSRELIAEFSGEIYKASVRLNSLVENLLDITRLETGRLELSITSVDLRDLVIEVLNRFGSISQDRMISVDIKGGLPELRFDYGFISQALYNIIDNCLKYTPDGSDISIAAGIDGNRAMITISDTGPGLPDEALPKIFDKFYRAPGVKPGGAGLGLSIAKGFIEAHGGTLCVGKNNPNGLVFDIILPVVNE